MLNVSALPLFGLTYLPFRTVVTRLLLMLDPGHPGKLYAGFFQDTKEEEEPFKFGKVCSIGTLSRIITLCRCNKTDDAHTRVSRPVCSRPRLVSFQLKACIMHCKRSSGVSHAAKGACGSNRSNKKQEKIRRNVKIKLIRCNKVFF